MRYAFDDCVFDTTRHKLYRAGEPEHPWFPLLNPFASVHT
jgi:hypothetical protein